MAPCHACEADLIEGRPALPRITVSILTGIHCNRLAEVNKGKAHVFATQILSAAGPPNSTRLLSMAKEVVPS